MQVEDAITAIKITW